METNTYQYDRCPHYNEQRLVDPKDGPSNHPLDIVSDNLELFVEIRALQWLTEEHLLLLFVMLE